MIKEPPSFSRRLLCILWWDCGLGRYKSVSVGIGDAWRRESESSGHDGHDSGCGGV